MGKKEEEAGEPFKNLPDAGKRYKNGTKGRKWKIRTVFGG